MSKARLEPKYNAVLPKYLGIVCYSKCIANKKNYAHTNTSQTLKELVDYFKWKSVSYLVTGFNRDSITKPVMYVYVLNETQSEYVCKYMYAIGPNGGIKRKARNNYA
ncbi:hypothetical protein SEA_GIBBLES_108 [Gordonia phage Gibbles]|nr:hypothetical protein SEA_GIBBLES_108 [Gordonia phage Gibbles]